MLVESNYCSAADSRLQPQCSDYLSVFLAHSHHPHITQITAFTQLKEYVLYLHSIIIPPTLYTMLYA